MRSLGYIIMLSPLWIIMQTIALCTLARDAVVSFLSYVKKMR